MQGRAQKFEKGEGPDIKAKPAGPDIVLSKKYKNLSIFRSKTREEQKKNVITAVDCPLYEKHLYLVHLSARGKGPRTQGPPPGVRPCNGQTELLPWAPHFGKPFGKHFGNPALWKISSSLIVHENFGKFQLKLRPAYVMIFFCSSPVFGRKIAHLPT